MAKTSLKFEGLTGVLHCLMDCLLQETDINVLIPLYVRSTFLTDYRHIHNEATTVFLDT